MNNKIDESNYTADQLEGYTSEQLEMFSADQLDEIESSDTDIEIWEAGVDAGIDFEYIVEAYQGEFNNDIEFVQDLLDQIGDLPDLPNYIHINWEMTANDVMMDYSESNGSYFRNL